MDYFETLKTNVRNDYLMMNPKKADVIENAKKEGVSVILPNSNNRALAIFNNTAKYLQSYDTLILKVEYIGDKIKITKLWNGYSKTTMKHINEFMKPYTGAENTFNKKEWEAFKEMTL